MLIQGQLQKLAEEELPRVTVWFGKVDRVGSDS